MRCTAWPQSPNAFIYLSFRELQRPFIAAILQQFDQAFLIGRRSSDFSDEVTDHAHSLPATLYCMLVRSTCLQTHTYPFTRAVARSQNPSRYFMALRQANGYSFCHVLRILDEPGRNVNSGAQGRPGPVYLRGHIFLTNRLSLNYYSATIQN